MPGRFFLGLGSGERLNEQVTGDRWPSPKERRERLEEAVAVIRKLWEGKSVSHAGEHFRVERARLFSRPDTPPPLVLAAGGKKTARLAGDIADGMVGVTDDPKLVEAFEAARRHDQAPARPGAPVLGRDRAGGTPHRAPLVADQRRSPTRSSRSWPCRGSSRRPRTVDEDDIVANVACGPDPEVHVAAVKRFVAAGYTTVFLHQIGPEQCGFLQFAQNELLPRLPIAL